jgi:intraflagellar transport protein 122
LPLAETGLWQSKCWIFQLIGKKMMGFVVGLSGAKVFCLNGSSMVTLELPLSAPMYQYIDKKMYEEAYKVACLGFNETRVQIKSLKIGS